MLNHIPQELVTIWQQRLSIFQKGFEAYNSYMSVYSRPVHVPQYAKQNLIKSNIIRKNSP